MASCVELPRGEEDRRRRASRSFWRGLVAPSILIHLALGRGGSSEIDAVYIDAVFALFVSRTTMLTCGSRASVRDERLTAGAEVSAGMGEGGGPSGQAGQSGNERMRERCQRARREEKHGIESGILFLFRKCFLLFLRINPSYLY